MTVPLQISYRNIGPSDSLDRQIRGRVDELALVHPRITGCVVTVALDGGNQRHGRIFHIGVDLKVPGHEVVVNRQPYEDHAHEDAHVAIRDAFDAARRQLDHIVRREREARRRAPDVADAD